MTTLGLAGQVPPWKKPKPIRWYVALWKAKAWNFWLFKIVKRGSREKPLKGVSDLRYVMAFLQIDQEVMSGR